jgi:uncharacterized protein (TIGR00369 family)
MSSILNSLQSRGKQTVLETLKITIESAEPELIVLSMPVEARVHQYTGLLHGGVSVVLAETAASIGAALNTDLNRFTPVGVEINANHLRSISKGTVTAEARPVYLGRQMSVWGIEIKDEKKRLISVSRCTLALKPGSALAASDAISRDDVSNAGS